jgi:hypothetical protein
VRRACPPEWPDAEPGPMGSRLHAPVIFVASPFERSEDALCTP